MVLVDTSIWVDHFQDPDHILAALLNRGSVLGHPIVRGELALGRLRQRPLILTELHTLPQAVVATYAEVLHFIEERDLAGAGIGYVDAHLLASTILTAGTTLWTRDRRLNAVALKLGCGASVALH